MKKFAYVAAAFAAMVMLMGAPAQAQQKQQATNGPLVLIPEWLTGEMDPKLAVSNLAVSLASTGAYFALEDGGTMISDKGGAWGATTIGCLAVSPIVGTLVVQRELTQREVFVTTAGCILPIVGPWLMNRSFDHFGWDAQRPRVAIK